MQHPIFNFHPPQLPDPIIIGHWNFLLDINYENPTPNNQLPTEFNPIKEKILLLDNDY
jgi:hypothetical protein